MADLKEFFQSADWKAEKHVPVIEAADMVKKGELLKVTVSVGKEIPHPNKAEHFISWIAIYFAPQGEKYPYEIARAEFYAHGASVNGAETSTVYTHPEITASFKTDKPGVIYASSLCNIHGLWQSNKELKIG